MQRYPIRASARKSLTPESLEAMAREQFGSASRADGAVQAKFGAIAGIKAWAEAKELCVDVVMDPKVTDSVASETIARYNRFLEAATGYSAKERASRLRKAAKGADG